MRPSSLGCWCAVFFAACASSPDLPPSAVQGMPWRAPGDVAAGADDVERHVLRARDLHERGDGRAAAALLAEILAKHPRHTEARRLRQDVLRERGRRGLLLAELEQALAAAPDDAIAHYLHGRVVLEPAQKLASFQRAVAADPESFWPWLGLAHSLRATDPERALRIYERLLHASGSHPIAGIAYAALLREQEEFTGAARLYDWLRADPRVPGVGDLGLAQVFLAQEQRDPAWAALLAALQKRPYDAGVQGLVQVMLESGVASGQVEELLDTLRGDPPRWQAFLRGRGGAVATSLLLRSGQPVGARLVLDALATTPATPSLRRWYRRLRLGAGDVAGFLRQLREDVPLAVVDDESSTVRGRWLRLLRGPWHDGDWAANEAQTVQLLEALRDVGWLQEVGLLADVASTRWPAAAAIAALQAEVRSELAFEGGLRRLLYRGYQQQDQAELAVVVERIRALSQQVLGRDVVGTPTTFAAPLVGEMLDPFTGGLAEHLARYNRHLVLGRRANGVAEGLLVTRLAVRELPAVRELHLPGRCFEVVGIDRDVTSLGGVLGGDLAGVALLNHFLIDHDAVRDWAFTVAERRRVAREDGLALLHDPLPKSSGLDPLDVAWRLSLMSPAQDSELDAAVLDTIRTHERQHLVDAFRYLPIEKNVFRGLGLLLSFGFSPAAIEAEMERRAELAALALSPHTEIVLAHIADFMSEPGGPAPHHAGFARLGTDLMAALVADGLSPADVVPARWHLLPMAQVRAAAQRLLAELNLPPD